LGVEICVAQKARIERKKWANVVPARVETVHNRTEMG
jgi:hypothetical protein